MTGQTMCVCVRERESKRETEREREMGVVEEEPLMPDKRQRKHQGGGKKGHLDEWIKGIRRIPKWASGGGKQLAL